jgi:hypothetical protein
LATARKEVNDLPTTVVLNDNLGMRPGEELAECARSWLWWPARPDPAGPVRKLADRKNFRRITVFAKLGGNFRLANNL